MKLNVHMDLNDFSIYKVYYLLLLKLGTFWVHFKLNKTTQSNVNHCLNLQLTKISCNAQRSVESTEIFTNRLNFIRFLLILEI